MQYHILCLNKFDNIFIMSLKQALPSPMGLSWWLSGKRIHLQCSRCRRHGFSLWVGKIPWRRAWEPTVVFLPGASHELRSLVSYSPWGRKESDMTEETEHAGMSPVLYSGIHFRKINMEKNIYARSLEEKHGINI